MDLAFPKKYHEVVKYFDYYIGDLEKTPLLTDVQKLMFYALRQQADHGQCITSAPPIWYTTERKKHQAWKQLGRMSTFEAMVFFVQQFEEILMQLEKPATPLASTSAPTPRNAGVDWPSRLQEMEAKTSPKPKLTQHSSGALASEGVHADRDFAAVGQSPSPVTVDEEVPHVSSPSLSRDAEMVAWDADILSHSAVTLENIRYLASELMHARHALRQLREEGASQHVEQNGAIPCTSGLRSRETSLWWPPPRPGSIATGPPLKPIWGSNGNAARAPMVAPPMRPSARSMTEAAVGVSLRVLHLKTSLDTGKSTDPGA
ncbi:hypothetical protein JKF63_00949 [Porcisia hertigi]|uniref:ACB domain-containing protein n=1 Tax=Porcisia hertigi TaxID=2761500 RepID=A0A836GZ85_9TRYP|nr:hypothetical protein JKF63_00949 [Porcisia hertigi]